MTFNDGFNIRAVPWPSNSPVSGNTLVYDGSQWLAGTASGVISGIASLFGVKSPLDKVKEFVPIADKISLIGEGIKNFGDGIININTGIKDFDKKALAEFKDKLLEFAEAGSSDEMRLTAENLSKIGTSIAQIAQAGEIKLPNLGDLNAGALGTGSIDTAGLAGQNNSAITPDVVQQVMSYLSEMNSDLSAIRTNTKGSGFEAPVRLG